MSDEYKDKFPEKWLCPYCTQEVPLENQCMIDRDDIPNHLTHKHGWDSYKLTWKYIYERLSAVGGV